VSPSLAPFVFDLAHVQHLRHRPRRDAAQQFLVEGLRFLILSRDARREVDGLVLAPDLVAPSTRALARRLAGRRTPVLEVDATTYRGLSGAAEPQGIMAVVTQCWASLGRAPRPRDLWLALSHVRSPGNLGTLLRTCDAAGARGAVLLGPDVDPHDPGCVRASMGSILARRLVRLDDASALRAWLRRSGGILVGAAPGATRDYRAVNYRRPVAFLLGDERKGLSDEDVDLCDVLVRIPMAGRLDSLNVAVAGSLLLYEAWSQRHPC
jgi:TrmH family RNA methyltransferase